MDSLFSCYAKHMSELDHFVNCIEEEVCSNTFNGHIDLTGYDDLSELDLKYIENSLRKKGISIKIWVG